MSIFGVKPPVRDVVRDTAVQAEIRMRPCPCSWHATMEFDMPWSQPEFREIATYLSEYEPRYPTASSRVYTI